MTNHKEKYTKSQTRLKKTPVKKKPEQVDPVSIEKFKNIKRADLSLKDYIQGILNSDITILSKAITIIESNKKEHSDLAHKIVEACLPYSGKSVRIGITGIPGAGKSTFIETFGNFLLKKKKKIAVLAIDPSSEKSKGSILGDKTRMETLSQNPNVFIRPTPSSGKLGGVANKTRETIILCEAAGFDTIIIETVGVGQSEVIIRHMVDIFMLLMIAGAGDELQGIKRGIMEMADLVIINKKDGDNVIKAEQTKTEIEKVLHYFTLEEYRPEPKAFAVSSINKTGFDEIWIYLKKHLYNADKKTFLIENRKKQLIFWLHETIKNKIIHKFYTNPQVITELKKIEKQIITGQLDFYKTINQLIKKYTD